MNIKKFLVGGLFSVLLSLFVVLPAQAETLVNVYNLQPSWTTLGGEGVWAAYYTGPYDSRSVVSPGSTEVYNGREAGIIKAGFVTTEPWDEGLLGFKVPEVSLSTFVNQTLTYVVQNETGTNPVWVRIRFTNGIQYQFVPITNPASWHTVNAAAGEWQLMDNDTGNAIGGLMTLDEVATANPTAVVDRVYLTMGMGNSYNVGTDIGTVAWVDKVTIGEVTYDFVVNGIVPTTKDQCKNGGWESFTSHTFKNQGECVSYVQSNDHAGKR